MISRLVGKSDRHVDRDKLIFYSRLLYQVKMGYIDIENQTAHQSIVYQPEEHLYDHDLSYQSIGRRYTSMKLSDHITLDFYLNNPPEISDEILQGMMIGIEDREKLEEAAQEAAKAKEALAREQAAQQMNQLHEKPE